MSFLKQLVFQNEAYGFFQNANIDSCIHQISYHMVISYSMVSNEHHVTFEVVHIKLLCVHLPLPEQPLTRSSLPSFT